MLGRGALVGLAAGIAAQWLVGGVEGELGWLVRLALLLPAIVFVAWWLLIPGLRLEEPDDLAAPAASDPAVLGRVDRIETVFDSAAVPRARRERLDPPSDGLRDTYRSSVRRQASAIEGASDAWRIRGSVRPTGNGTTGNGTTGS